MPRKESNGTFKDELAKYYTVCPNKCILRSFKFLANNIHIHLLGHNVYQWLFLMFICRYCKVKCSNTYVLYIGIYAISWHSKSSLSVKLIEILTRFIVLWQKNVGFFKSIPSARLYLEVLVMIARLNLKTICFDCLLGYISFCFLFSSLRLYFLLFSL